MASVAFSPDGALLASGSHDPSPTIKYWDVATHTCTATRSGHTADIWSVAFSPDGALLASGSASGLSDAQHATLRSLGALDALTNEPTTDNRAQLIPIDTPEAEMQLGNSNPTSEIKPPKPETALSSLPPQPTPFIGRSVEIAEIARILADPACRLLTLIGPGGIGKTRLALEVAARHASAFSDGVVFVGLASVSAPAQIVSAIAMRWAFRSPASPI